jgi:hypothetical protein
MKIVFLNTILFGLFFIPLINAQSGETHIWKVLEKENGEKAWYDAAGIDTIKGEVFDIWILTVNKPPVKYEGVDGDVYRVKTLYTVNLNSVRYGILEVIYYDVQNKEIFNYDYNNPPQPESIKYAYPITENSLMHDIVKEIFGPGGIKSKQ